MYIRIYIHTVYMCSYVCFTSVYAGPSALTVKIMKNIESLSILVQWDAVDDSLPTTYTIIWTDEGGLFEVAILIEQTSYAITGLTLDTVYTITVTAANTCGQGPEFNTSISFSTYTTSTTSVTASTNPMITVNPSTTTTTTTVTSSNIITTMNIPTTASMTTTDSGNAGTTIKTTSVKTTTTSITSGATITTTIINPSTTTTATTADESSKFSSTFIMIMNV